MRNGGGWILVFSALFSVIAWGVTKGLRIEEITIPPGQDMGPRYGFADENPDARTLMCRYITWSGVVERVYRYRYSNPDVGSYCPLLMESEQEAEETLFLTD